MDKQNNHENENLLICNRSHICPTEPCKHKTPHKGQCGPAMPCKSDPSGQVSQCVPVENGQFKTYHRDWCPHCKGKGYHDRYVSHDVPESLEVI